MRTSLPVMGPCLTAPLLTPQQYSTAMRAVREILGSLDASKGATPSVAGNKQSFTGSLPAQEQAVSATVAPVLSQSPTGSANNALFGSMSLPPPSGASAVADFDPTAGFSQTAGSGQTGGFGQTGARGSTAARPSPLAPPPPPPPKANTLADAFSSLGSGGNIDPMPAAAASAPAAADTDSMFDFQPYGSTGSQAAKAARAPAPLLGQLPSGGPPAPLLGQPPSAASRQTPVMQQHTGFGSFPASSSQKPDDFGSGSLI